jgi:phage head maturation protease
MGDLIDAAITGSQRFKIFVPQLTASVDGDTGQKMLNGIASSTVKDLHGDRMTENAIAEMERAAGNNLTIFLNHSYAVPEDVAGSVVKATVTRTTDGEVVDLHFDIAINEENERAVKAWAAIKGSENRRPTKLGLSIGAMIPEGGATWDATAKGYIINHIELLETSIVGVPANPRSWVEYAVKALGAERTAKAAQSIPIGQPSLTLDSEKGTYQITGQLGDVAVIRDAPAAGEKVEPEAAAAAAPATEVPAEPETTPEAPAVDASKAKITVIEVDTGTASDDGAGDDDSAGSSDESDPENGATGMATAAAPTDAPAEDAVSKALSVLGPATNAALKSSTELVLALSGELEATRAALTAMTAERDEAVELARSVLATTSKNLTALKNLPMGRRAVVADTTDRIERSIADVISPAALKVLELAEAAEPATK